METIKDRLRATSIYCHLPFCKSKCPYCDFNSIAIDDPRQLEEIEATYLDAVLRELKDISTDESILAVRQPPSSVYFGGGTPSLMSPRFFETLLSAIEDQVGRSDNTEITIEANPDSIDLNKLREYRKLGINRLSIGIQSLNDRDLKVLGRPHTAKEAIDAFKAARKAGFENISIDLIFALPDQSLGEWEAVLKEAASLEAEHISIYGLTIEEGTPFMASKERGEIKPSPEALEIEMYERAVEQLTKHGYTRYEISNFAMPSRESRHNSGYWTGRDYIGLGAGAHSYVSSPDFGKRYWNTSDVAEYITATARLERVAGQELLTKEEAMTEALMVGLRLTKGISIDDFKARFGVTPMELLDYKKLLSLNTLEVPEGQLRLTDKGILLSNEIFKTISP
ncbi:MAG: radical SAM family heme chaperone HemW [Deltaproteobacteria bacterium]|nr:radical SAM family heme chaperone HemW [Deltaproteobacteria bacterium]